MQFFQQDGALFAGGDADAFAAKYDSVQLLVSTSTLGQLQHECFLNSAYTQSYVLVPV